VDTSAHAGICEYYMINKDIWLDINPKDAGMLCIGCAEDRLGRQLTQKDFTDAPVNFGIFPQSDRFLNRMSRK